MLAARSEMNVDAAKVVSKGFPTDEGKVLARHVLKESGNQLTGLTIDLTDCQSAMLISAFFNSFLQHIYDTDHTLLSDAKKTNWVLKFDFQREKVHGWMNDFSPTDS